MLSNLTGNLTHAMLQVHCMREGGVKEGGAAESSGAIWEHCLLMIRWEPSAPSFVPYLVFGTDCPVQCVEAVNHGPYIHRLVCCWTCKPSANAISRATMKVASHWVLHMSQHLSCTCPYKLFCGLIYVLTIWQVLNVGLGQLILHEW